MLKKRIIWVLILLVISLGGQVLLRPTFGGGIIDSNSIDDRQDGAAPKSESAQSGGSDTSRPYSDDTVPLQGDLVRQFMYMLGLVALIGLGAWLVCRKFTCGVKTAGGGRMIHISETIRLGPRKAVHMIRVGSKTLLIANAGDTLSLLADISESVPAEEGKEYD